VSIESNGMAGESTSYVHEPVMVAEIEAIFRSVPPGVVVDATVGGGGHARALLEANHQLSLIGLDQDDEALTAAATTLEQFGSRVVLRHRRFDRLSATVKELGHEKVAGVLFDLGVSSPQLDRAERGFSYRHDAPLDMRMDRTQSRTAAEVVNTYGEQELADVLRRFGDERHAARIARAIVAARPITTTGQLADIVRDAIPAPARRRGGHPAKRTFQAIRIEVNRELDVLPVALDQAIDVLMPGGRLAVLSYHSGEDRIVKARLHEAATGGCTCPPGLACVCGAVPKVRLLRRGAMKPSAEEVARNPRAESARLRAAERLAEPEVAA
jgi:16S rRNA (cytosine1402-N4)-methyltransferase